MDIKLGKDLANSSKSATICVYKEAGRLPSKNKTIQDLVRGSLLFEGISLSLAFMINMMARSEPEKYDNH